MNLNDFRYLRLEYSVGAKLIIFSLVDTSSNKVVLAPSNVTKMLIEYSYNGNSYTYENELSFHINSWLVFLKNLQPDTNIDFSIYLIYSENNLDKYKIQLTDIIHEHTLPYGNITYRIISSGNSSNDTQVENALINNKVFDYINDLGTNVSNESFDSYARYAKEIPFKYNENIATASAYYYRSNVSGNYGLIQTSGGSNSQYFKNNVMFHEMRHRYGIVGLGSHITRTQTGNMSSLYSYIEDKFSVLHNALKFETGRTDAKVWIFNAHSNICEGQYTDTGDYNYLAANYIKALVWYTCHNTSDTDESKIRIITPLNISLISGELNGNTVDPISDNSSDNNFIDDNSINIDNDEENDSIEYNNNTKNVHKYNNKKIINIENYQYVYEYLKNGEDFDDLGCSNNFVILRNFEFINNIEYDKDIFFVEKSIYENSLEDICYPLYKNDSLFFTNKYDLYLDYNIDIKDITYDIYQRNSDNVENIANILCDKIRIYNPVINKNMDFIIYIDNYINDIHFHYLCNINKNYKKKYCKEMKINNNRYIEYIEINIPNISKLFSKSNKYYIKEDFNKIYECNIEELNDKELIKYLNNHDKICTNNLYLYNIIQPFIIEKQKKYGEEMLIKTFINNDYFNYNNHYINTSINITLYPYKNINNDIYVLKENLSPVSSFISYSEYFNLSSKLGFDHGIISLINEFNFPGKLKKDTDTNFNNLTAEEIIQKRLEEINIIDNQVTNYYNTFYLNENINDIEENYEDYFDDLNIESIRTTGYIIQFANDIKFKDIIWESVINTDNNKNNFIYDFSFSLNNMVDSWDQLNEILIIRAMFIDKRLNKQIVGNNVVLTKEWFKYLINESTNNNLTFNYNNLIENKFMDVNKGFNFIDNITCVIKEENNNQNISINNDINNTKIIYKPIFYKVQDLQNIRIRTNITQKIGINLGDYLNKVNVFILNIDNQVIKESSRNDIYVIFEINANNLENNSGYYNILNEDFEYISSGNYIKY